MNDPEFRVMYDTTRVVPVSNLQRKIFYQFFHLKGELIHNLFLSFGHDGKDIRRGYFNKASDPARDGKPVNLKRKAFHGFEPAC